MKGEGNSAVFVRVGALCRAADFIYHIAPPFTENILCFSEATTGFGEQLNGSSNTIFPSRCALFDCRQWLPHNVTLLVGIILWCYVSYHIANIPLTRKHLSCNTKCVVLRVVKGEREHCIVHCYYFARRCRLLTNWDGRLFHDIISVFWSHFCVYSAFYGLLL